MTQTRPRMTHIHKFIECCGGARLNTHWARMSDWIERWCPSSVLERPTFRVYVTPLREHGREGAYRLGPPETSGVGINRLASQGPGFDQGQKPIVLGVSRATNLRNLLMR